MKHSKRSSLMRGKNRKRQNKVLPNPVFTKAGATTPHNCTAITYSSNYGQFGQKYDYSVRTINDILRDCEKLQRECELYGLRAPRPLTGNK